jgi:hypothetical protein
MDRALSQRSAGPLPHSRASSLQSKQPPGARGRALLHMPLRRAVSASAEETETEKPGAGAEPAKKPAVDTKKYARAYTRAESAYQTSEKPYFLVLGLA